MTYMGALTWSSVVCKTVHKNISSSSVYGNHYRCFEDLCVYQWHKTVQRESVLILVMAVCVSAIIDHCQYV